MASSTHINQEEREEDVEEENLLAVQQPSKIETLEESKAVNKTPIWLSMIKWLFTLILFAATLFCLVASKVFLISTASHLRNATFRKVCID